MASAPPRVEETTPARCGACGAARPQPEYPVRDLIWASEGEWGFVRCGECGHGYLDPRPSDPALGAFYTALYTPENLETMVKIGEGGFDRRLRAARVRDLARAAQGRPARLLDVGCGVGFFLHELHAVFPEAEAIGVEMGPGAADRAASLPGLTVLREPFEALDLPAGSVDVLSMNHLLEHLPEPAAAQRTAAELVRPGGLIEVEIPRMGGWGQARLGRWWWPHLPPQHIQLFSRDGLVALLAQAGFSEVCSERTTGYPLTLSAAVVFVFRFTVGSESRFARNPLVRLPALLLGLALLPLTLLFDAVAAPLLNGPLGRGDLITVVARRDGAAGG